MEHLVRNLLGRIKNVNHKEVERFYFGTADFFNHSFTPDQKIKLYHFLMKIFYLVPMTPLNLLILDEYYDSEHKIPIQ